MTRKEQVLADREAGMTYSQIARKNGISYQYVGQICGKSNPNNFRCHGEKHVYINLRNWMNENKISINELVRMMGNTAYSKNCSIVSSWLTGRKDPPKKAIDKLIEVTGMPYEVLFQKEKNNEYCR